MLLYGAPGAGKRQIADALALEWLNPDPNGEPTQATSTFESGRNPDVLRVEPIGAGRMILGRQISPSRGSGESFDGLSVIEFLRTSPIVSKNKVVILDEAERLHPAAANALLKTLEEPHPYAKFILMTGAVGSILPTILSRCVAIACELPEVDERKELKIDEDFWKLAQGSPGLAKRFSEDADHYRRLLTFAKNLKQRKKSEAISVNEEFRSIVEKIQGERAARAANAEALELLGVAVSIYHPGWHEAGREIAEAHRRILGNANSGLTFDALFTGILTG